MKIKIKFSDKEIEFLTDYISHLVEDAGFILTTGYYYTHPEDFKFALKKSLESGENIFEELNRIIGLSIRSSDNFSPEDMAFYSKVTSGKSVLNLNDILCEEDIKKIKNTVAGHKRKNTHHYKMRQGFTEKLKERVRNRDNNKCTKCDETNDLEVHHILPLIDGGDNSMDNLVTLCHKHHRQAHRELKKHGGGE